MIVEVPAAVPRAPTPIPAWVTLATSGLPFAISSGFATVAWRDQRDLDGKRLPDGRYDLAGVSQAQARSGQQGINDAWTASDVTAGLGVAALVYGLWLLGNPIEARHPPGASSGTP